MKRSALSRQLWVLCVSAVISIPAFAVTYYVDGSWGNNALDGTTNVVLDASTGPKLNIAAGITAAGNGDTLSVAAGFYQETNWVAGTGTRTILPQGTVTIYGSDPWMTDTDGDGIPDEWEVAYGLNPFATNDAGQASALPWAQGLSNLQVYQLGIDPRLTDAPEPEIEIHYSVSPNDAGWWHTNVVVWFTATNAVYLTPGSSVYFTSETNDAEIVATAVNAAGVVARTSTSINIDKSPPVVTLDPGAGQTNDLSNPLLVVTYSDPVTTSSVAPSGLNLDSLAIRIDEVDVTTNFYRFSSGAVGNGSNLVAGTHHWSATIADIAGNVTAVSNTFIATGAINTNAPAITNLNLAADFTVMPDVPEIWLQGNVTGGTNSLVFASVNGGDAIRMNQRGNMFGYLLPLEFGTNVIVLTAADSTTNNLSSRVALVERSNRYRAAITSPAFGTFANGQAQAVSGYVSAKKDEGLPSEEPLEHIRVNGVEATIRWDQIDSSNNVPFNCTVPVPADGSPSSLNVQIIWPSTDTIPLGLLEGYWVTEKQTTYDLTVDDSCHSPASCTGEGHDVWHDEYSFSGASANGTNSIEIYAFSENYSWTCSPGANTSSNVSTHGEWLAQPSWDLKLGTAGDHTEDVNCNEKHQETWSGHMNFQAPCYYPPNTTAIFTFDGVDYARPPGEPCDLSQVKYQGQDPIAWNNCSESNGIRYGGSVNYLVTLNGGQTYTLDESSLSGPAGYTTTETDGQGQTITVTGHWISFTGFHNAIVTVQSLTVASVATQDSVRQDIPHKGDQNWVADEGIGDVIVQAKTGPNDTPAEWDRIDWSGGDPVTGHANQRKLSRNLNGHFPVSAKIGGSSAKVDVWVVDCGFTAYADPGELQPVPIGHGWWQLIIAPADASILPLIQINPNPDPSKYINVEAGYFPKNGGPVGVGTVKLGPQGHQPKAQRTWPVAYSDFVPGVVYTYNLVLKPSTYDVLHNNCTHKTSFAAQNTGLGGFPTFGTPQELYNYLFGLQFGK